MMLILVKSDDIRSGRMAKARHGRLGPAWKSMGKKAHNYTRLTMCMEPMPLPLQENPDLEDNSPCYANNSEETSVA